MTVTVDLFGLAAFVVSLTLIGGALWRLLQMVTQLHDRMQTWDNAARAMAKVAERSVETATHLLRIERSTNEIEAQVTYNSGDSLKDRLLQHQRKGDERHAVVDRRFSELGTRLDAIEAHLADQDRNAARYHPRAGEE